jgi:hypothetical protein
MMVCGREREKKLLSSSLGRLGVGVGMGMLYVPVAGGNCKTGSTAES